MALFKGFKEFDVVEYGAIKSLHIWGLKLRMNQ